MKRFLPVLAVLSTSAFANDLMLSDLNYFQKSGSVLVNTSIGLGSNENKATDDLTNPTNFTKNEGKSTVWSNQVTYGLADNLNIGLEFDYFVKNSNEATSNGSVADKEYENNGLSDFTITGAYRLMNSGTFVDLTGGLTIGMGDREDGASNSATQAVDGNAKQGHNSLDLGVAAGQKHGQFEWRAGFNLDYHMSGDRKRLSSTGGAATNLDTDSYMNMTLFGQGQYRVDKFVFGLNLAYANNGEQVLKVKPGTDKITLESHSTLTTGLTARYDLSSTVVLNAGYSMVNSYDVDRTDFDGTDTSKGKISDNKASVVTIGATLLF